MPETDDIQSELLTRYFAPWSDALPDLKDNDERQAFMERALPGLLLEARLFSRLLRGITTGDPYPDIRLATQFENEYLLYLDRRRLFSVRLYIYGPNEYTPVHDHNAWGVVGAVSGRMGVVHYRREDDGTREGYARLTCTERLVLDPGEIETALPLDDGIHQTGNADGGTIITVNVYGSPIRRLHINGFDLTHDRVYPIYAPRIRKRMLAEQAMARLP